MNSSINFEMMQESPQNFNLSGRLRNMGKTLAIFFWTLLVLALTLYVVYYGAKCVITKRCVYYFKYSSSGFSGNLAILAGLVYLVPSIILAGLNLLVLYSLIRSGLNKQNLKYDSD